MKTVFFLSTLCIINALPNNIQSKGKDKKQAPVVVAVKQENTMNKNISTSPTTNENLITTQLPKVAEKQENQDKQAMVKVPVEFANAFMPMVKYFSKFLEPKNTKIEKTNQVSKDSGCNSCHLTTDCNVMISCLAANDCFPYEDPYENVVFCWLVAFGVGDCWCECNAYFNLPC